MRLDESELICGVIGCGYVQDSLAKKTTNKNNKKTKQKQIKTPRITEYCRNL